MEEIFSIKTRTRSSCKKEITGSKKKNVDQKKDIVNKKKVVAPIVNSDSSESEYESESEYDHINRDHIFDKEFDH